MKKFLLIFILFLFSSCISLKKTDVETTKEFLQELAVDGFVNDSEDIPLIKGLKQTSEENLGFDTSSGSISSITYKSEIALKEIKEFYIKTLPQLGWNITKNKSEQLILIRDNEKVEISFINENGENLVKFLLVDSL